VSVEGNHLTSRAVVPGFSSTFSSQLAATVWLSNLGFSYEDYLALQKFSEAKSAPAFQPGLDKFWAGRSLATGPVLFNDNRVTLDALDVASSFALSSVLIVTADDLGFQDNHCDANLVQNDFVVTNGFLLGASSRTNSNRFTEGRLNAFFSALTVGSVANTTTINQATHCILALGARLKFALNTEIVGVNPLFGGDLTCERLQRAFSKTETVNKPHG
jgi:hypothetical protein